MEKNYDLFLSHASEDKTDFAEPLAKKLQSSGLNVWFDAFSLTPGHSLRRSIEYGLSSSRCGVIVLSRNFFEKSWPQQEVDGLFALGVPLIPVLYGIDIEYVKSKSPLLATITAIHGERGLEHVADEIQKGIRNRDDFHQELFDVIMCVGSAVGENVLQSPIFALGQKNIGYREELLGGSALNHVSRLLAMGYPAVPVLSVGKDRIGERIQSHILELLKKLQNKAIAQRIAEFVLDEGFFCPHIKTIESTIIVSGNQRTILTEEPSNIGEFEAYVKRRIKQLTEHFPDFRVKALMIGHIYSDNLRFNSNSAGDTTRYLLEEFKNSFVFTNFGQSQIGLGWETNRGMMNRISLFQLSMTEVKEFLHGAENNMSLEKIIGLFQGKGFQKTSTVITLDKFGALALESGREGGLYLAWPHDVPNLVDTTGAGDAFGAGLVAMLYCGKKNFHSALEEARMWAAYACTTLGGAHNCPDESTLEGFKCTLRNHRGSKNEDEEQVEFLSVKGIQRLLWLLDRSF